jgi:hypothetical protein
VLKRKSVGVESLHCNVRRCRPTGMALSCAAPVLLSKRGMSDAFARAVRGLLENATKHIEMGRKARAWAEEAFDIAAIGNRFHTLLVGAAEIGRRSRGQND